MIIRCETEDIFPFDNKKDLTEYMLEEEIVHVMYKWRNDGKRFDAFTRWLENIAAKQYAHELTEKHGQQFMVIESHLNPEEKVWLESIWYRE